MSNEISVPKLTEMLFVVPYPPEKKPDPMGNSFENLEKRIAKLIDYLWDNQRILEDNKNNLHPIWKVSLRMTILYLNMSNGFDACGGEFTKASLEEKEFVENYQNTEGNSRLDRAARMLSRAVALLRKLDFSSQLLSIGGDAAYYGACEETAGILNELKNTTK